MAVQTTGQNRTPPLKAPRPLFFVDPHITEPNTNFGRDEDVTVVHSSPSSPNMRRLSTSPLNLDGFPPVPMHENSKGFGVSDSNASIPTIHASGSYNKVKSSSPSGSVANFSLPTENGEIVLRPTSGDTYVDTPVVEHYPDPTLASRTSSIGDLRSRPNAGSTQWPGVSSSSTMNVPGMRKSFASPPMRPVTFSNSHLGDTPSVSSYGIASMKRAKSTMLASEIEKPWLSKKDTNARFAYYLTYGMTFVGIIASAIRIYFGWIGVPMMSGNLCLILDDEFNGNSLDETIWQYEVSMGGFGNEEFEMTTSSSNNSFLRDGYLYILPTLTSDVIGREAVLNGYTYNITGCTTATTNDTSSCGAVSNQTAGTVINPAMSARLTTKNSRNIQFGKVEIRAKIPTGDWLWPGLWMLPVNATYGPWPMSGEIDIMEARGNGMSYPDQGTNYVRGSLNWGPLTWLNEAYRTYGYWTQRWSTYSDGFHTYSLEWDESFLRIYVDTRLNHMLDISFNLPFFERGDFPPVVTNGSTDIVLQNPWEKGTVSAPFDIPFYLIMDVAVGGTSGWFPDNAGGKPWIDGASNAMQQFALAQDTWATAWPSDEYSRAMVVDYVKMWQKC